MWLAGLLTTDEKCKKLATEVLSRMSEDEIFHVIGNDELITMYGSAIPTKRRSMLPNSILYTYIFAQTAVK